MKINKIGFTLIELLTVVAIIGLLLTIAAVALRLATNQAKVAKAQHGVDTIYNAITMLGNDSSQWPGHQTPNETNATGNDEVCGPDATIPTPISCTHSIVDGWSGLEANDSATPFPNWAGPYMNNIQPDPWSHQYFFDTNYSIDNVNIVPCGCCSGCTADSAHCHNVVVVGSYGPDGLGADKLKAPYNNLNDSANSSSGACDDIIKIITFN